jgi:glycosyltransferase involved in cell wall biosynthesis
MKPSVTMVSGSNVLSGNATRILNLSKYITDTRMIFSSPRRDVRNAHFTHFSNRGLAIMEKSIKMLSDPSDLIHCFKTLPTSGIPSLVGKIKGKPMILDWDDFEGFGGFADQDPFPYNHIADRFERWIVRRADAITVVSPFLEKKVREFGFEKPVYFIPNGADTEGIRYSFPDNKGKLKLLFIGLLYKSSDLDFVLKSMTHLKEANLTVVGAGPRRKEFEKLAENLGLKNVEFAGMKGRDEVKPYLYGSDVALLPFVDNISNRSRSPVKLGEYLAAGKPIVTNNVGIMQKVMENGKNGIITKDNPEDFAKGVKKLESARSRKRISVNARKTAEKLSWKNIAYELSEIYEAHSK